MLDTSTYDDVRYKLSDVRQAVMSLNTNEPALRDALLDLIEVVSDLLNVTVDKLHEAASK